MKSGIRNAIVILLLIPLAIVLTVLGILPPHTLVPQVFGSLVFLIIFIAIVALGFETFAHIVSRSKALRMYKPPDPTYLVRAVRDGVDGSEYLISGVETTLFSQACLDNWQFDNVDKKSDWYIVDERGNDVSDEPLSRYGGVFTLIGNYRKVNPTDHRDEYSSIHDSVEYYD